MTGGTFTWFTGYRVLVGQTGGTGRTIAFSSSRTQTLSKTQRGIVTGWSFRTGWACGTVTTTNYRGLFDTLTTAATSN